MITQASRAELDTRGTLLDERRAAGLVRHCHGDQHLRNIALLDGRPTLFDGVEFNDERLFGLSPLDRLGPEGYSSEMSERVYATVAERARIAIREGHSAIVDAVYARPGDRQAIERVAVDVAVPFVGIWLEAPEATLVARAGQRRHDPSDADAAVIRLQHRDGTGVMGWHRVEASRPPDVVLEDASKYVHALVQRAPNIEAGRH